MGIPFLNIIKQHISQIEIKHLFLNLEIFGTTIRHVILVRNYDFRKFNIIEKLTLLLIFNDVRIQERRWCKGGKINSLRCLEMSDIISNYISWQMMRWHHLICVYTFLISGIKYSRIFTSRKNSFVTID